ncbi:hypothetical protein WP3S18C02_27590 [Klebsiella quasipneumoniae]|nr:hypothetical protein WP3S18C02_27590 [Klebsiella quasipneumoniae]
MMPYYIWNGLLILVTSFDDRFKRGPTYVYVLSSKARTIRNPKKETNRPLNSGFLLRFVRAV